MERDEITREELNEKMSREMDWRRVVWMGFRKPAWLHPNVCLPGV